MTAKGNALRTKATNESGTLWWARMGDDLEVKVLPEPGRRDRREAQGVRREAYAERSVKRTRESTNRNRIRGAADRGERTTDREAPATKGSGVDPAIVRGRSSFLPGEVSPDA